MATGHKKRKTYGLWRYVYATRSSTNPKNTDTTVIVDLNIWTHSWSDVNI